MKSKWPLRTIDTIAEKIGMGPFGSSIKVSTFVTKGIPIISGQHLKNFRLDESAGFNFITEEHAEKLANSNLFRGDVVFTHAGNIQNVSYIPEDSLYTRYVASQRQFYMRCNLEIVKPEWIVYHFKSRYGQYQLKANSSSVGVPSIAQPVSYLRQLKIPVPPLKTQEQIIGILNTFDDKIELNRRMNHTLEAMARAIFKSWFVDFDPVYAKLEGRDTLLPAEVLDLFPDELVESELGLIPKGWEVKLLDSVCKVTDCLHSKKPDQQEDGKLLLQVFNIGDAGRMDFSKKYYVSDADYSHWISRFEANPGDLIISKTGRVGAIAQIPMCIKAALGRNLVGIRANNKSLTQEYLRDYFLSSWMRIEKAKNTSQGTILQSLHVKHISKFRILVPSKHVLDIYSKFVSSIHQKMENNDNEIEMVSEMRDALLPRLISGEFSL